jgi:hypothetical protein
VSLRGEAGYLLGEEEYVYGFPLVMMDVTREVTTAASKSGQYAAPINQFARIRTYVNPDFDNVVRISVNSLWSFGFVDLDQEPMIVTVPDAGDRYLVMQAMNMWTDDFASVGTRTPDTTMAKDAKPLEDLNANAKRGVEETIYFSFIQKAMSSYPSGGTQLGEMLKSYAEKNIAAAQEYVNRLSQAKDLQDVVRIQTEFMQLQFNAFGEQTKSLGEAFTKAATGAVKASPFRSS